MVFDDTDRKKFLSILSIQNMRCWFRLEVKHCGNSNELPTNVTEKEKEIPL